MADPTDRPRIHARAAGVAALLAAATLLAGCGGSSPFSADRSSETTPTTTLALPPSHGGRGTLPPLDQVPQARRGTADAETQQVAERWFELVRHGDDEAAAALMADGARYVNGTIVILHDRAERVAVARSLPCGARPVAVGGGEDGYVVLDLRLTPKAGAGRCDGEGAPVTVAVHVRNGKIDDWVRVAGEQAAPDLGPEV